MRAGPFGKDVTGMKPYFLARLGLARSHQIVRPLNELSVRENVMVGSCFGRENQGLVAAATTADEVLEYVYLADRANQLANSLNIAEKKRLELARALASRPYLLLLDEVLAGLNPAEITTMVGTIQRIRAGITIIMIERHARRYDSFDRVIVGLWSRSPRHSRGVCSQRKGDRALGRPKAGRALMKRNLGG
jgi:branched-chain amino acid transport system ATP-binding protein